MSAKFVKIPLAELEGWIEKVNSLRARVDLMEAIIDVLCPPEECRTVEVSCYAHGTRTFFASAPGVAIPWCCKAANIRIGNAADYNPSGGAA